MQKFESRASETVWASSYDQMIVLKFRMRAEMQRGANSITTYILHVVRAGGGESLSLLTQYSMHSACAVIRKLFLSHKEFMLRTQWRWRDVWIE